MELFPGRTAYGLVVALALIDAVWLGVSPASLAPGQLIGPAALVAFLLAEAWVLGRGAGLAPPRAAALCHRIGALMQGIAFLQAAWITVRVFNHVSMTTDFAYADLRLSGWDAALGIDWRGYFDLVGRTPWLRAALDAGYTSLTFLSLIAFFVLLAAPDLRRARFFLESFLVTAIVCTGIGLFFPARAAVATYLGAAGPFPGFASPPGVYHLAALAQLRSGAVALDIGNLPGLVTFPSFHTAAGIVLLWAFWRTRAFPAAAAYVVLMIAATPVFGGHYGVDLIAGAALAAVICGSLARLPFYRGLFSRRPASTAQAGATRAPNSADPTRTWVAPQAIAASKSSLMPIDRPVSPWSAASPARRSKCGTGSSATGGIAINPKIGRS